MVVVEVATIEVVVAPVVVEVVEAGVTEVTEAGAEVAGAPPEQAANSKTMARIDIGILVISLILRHP